MRRIVAVVMVFMFIFGCLRSLGGDQFSQDYYSEIQRMGRIPISDPSQLENCSIGTCKCMVCESGRNIEALAFSNNLAGGKCFFRDECDAQRAYQIMSGQEDPDLTVRHFMVGQGPTFSDFAEAQPLCHYGLGMAVQWLIGDAEEPYDLPDASRAICLLMLDVMPVYVLYSNGTDINAEQAREVARILKEEGDEITLNTLITAGESVGPTIIVTEMDFRESQASLVAAQVREINAACNPRRDQGEINCFVAVAPKFNDFAALDAIMEQPGIKDQVDLVAYGINSEHSIGCEADPIVLQAVNFSKYALYNHSKPTVIPYIMFDVGDRDKANTCTWDERNVRDAYGAFFPHGIQPLHQRGVIGIAPYSLHATRFGVANPLNCTACDLAENQERLTAWFRGCQSYTNITRGSTLQAGGSFHRGGGTPIVFPNESAGFCDHNAQFDYLFRQIAYADAGGGGDFGNPREEMRGAMPMLYRCSSCISQNITNSDPPFAFEVRASPMTDEDVVKYCNSTPEIDAWADRRNLDPNLVRAVIATESDFDNCSAVRVCHKDYEGAGCFQRVASGHSECYIGGYDVMFDPREVEGDPNACHIENDDSDPPDWRRCAFGLMQVVEPPYTFWPSPPAEEEGQYLDVFQRTKFYDSDFVSDNLGVAESCAPPDGEFNPFNASHNLCVGTYKMASAMRSAESWMDNRRGFLNWNESDYEKDKAFQAYVAMNIYAGFWGSKARRPSSTCSVELTNGDCWAQHFFDSWEVTEDWCEENVDDDGEYPEPECTEDGEPNIAECYGYTDFVEYVRECEVEHLNRQADPGARKMNWYYWLRNNCPQTACPPHKTLLEAVGTRNDGTRWMDLVPDSGTTFVLDDDDTEEEEEEEEGGGG